jgi:hypothetical protein
MRKILQRTGLQDLNYSDLCTDHPRGGPHIVHPYPNTSPIAVRLRIFQVKSITRPLIPPLWATLVRASESGKSPYGGFRGRAFLKIYLAIVRLGGEH